MIKKYWPRILSLSPPAQLVLFGFYVLLSWILFFRNDRTINILKHYYPNLAPALEFWRIFLLSHYLNSLPTLLFIVFVLLVFAVYFRNIMAKLPVKTIVTGAIVFQILGFFSNPVLSNDIYSYINSDRLAVIYNQNIWRVPPDAFPQERFYPFALDTRFVRIYGPVNQAIYDWPTYFSGNDVWVNLAVHKLVVIGFVFLTLWLIYHLLKTRFPERLSWGLVLIFWNPLFIIETAGSGHNDILMLFFLLLAFSFFLSRRYLFSGLAVALAVQVKTTPLILLPFMGIFFLRRFEVKNAVIFFGAFLMTYLATFLTMNTTFAQIIARQGAANNALWQSLPFILHHYLNFLLPILTMGLIVLITVQAIRVLRGADPWYIFAETTFLYLLFYLPTIWNWYFLWILVFLPFFPFLPFTGAVLGATLGSLLAYPLDWIRLRLNYRWDGWQVIMYLSLVLNSILGFWYVRKNQRLLEKK